MQLDKEITEYSSHDGLKVRSEFYAAHLKPLEAYS